MNVIFEYALLFAKGAGVTLLAWLSATTCSLLIGIFCGILSCAYLSRAGSIYLIRIYTFVAKGIPAYVQILIAYFLPAACGIHIPGFIAAVGALAFCSGGYVTEIIRSTINNIPQGQWYAGKTLGYSMWDTLRRIIMPQVLRASSAALMGELEQLLKSTSLLATIGITELTRTGMNIISRELNPLSIYAIVAGIYLCFSLILTLVSIYMSKRNSHGYY